MHRACGRYERGSNRGFSYSGLLPQIILLGNLPQMLKTMMEICPTRPTDMISNGYNLEESYKSFPPFQNTFELSTKMERRLIEQRAAVDEVREAGEHQHGNRNTNANTGAAGQALHNNSSGNQIVAPGGGAPSGGAPSGGAPSGGPSSGGVNGATVESGDAAEAVNSVGVTHTDDSTIRLVTQPPRGNEPSGPLMPGGGDAASGRGLGVNRTLSEYLRENSKASNLLLDTALLILVKARLFELLHICLADKTRGPTPNVHFGVPDSAKLKDLKSLNSSLTMDVLEKIMCLPARDMPVSAEEIESFWQAWEPIKNNKRSLCSRLWGRRKHKAEYVPYVQQQQQQQQEKQSVPERTHRDGLLVSLAMGYLQHIAEHGSKRKREDLQFWLKRWAKRLVGPYDANLALTIYGNNRRFSSWEILPNDPNKWKNKTYDLTFNPDQTAGYTIAKRIVTTGQASAGGFALLRS